MVARTLVRRSPCRFWRSLHRWTPVPYLLLACHAAVLADRIDKRQYRRFAKSINGIIAHLVANCHLPPEADAGLYIVLAEMMDGVAAMEGQQEIGTEREGALMIFGAMDRYAQHFDDPGFAPIVH